MPTPYQIYQAYLRSPAAILRLFGQTFGTAVLCDPPAPEDLQQQTISAQAAEIARRTARVELSLVRADAESLKNEPSLWELLNHQAKFKLEAG